MSFRISRFNYLHTNQANSALNEVKLINQWQLLGLMLIGFVLPPLASVGKAFGYGFLLFVGFLFLDILLKKKQSSPRFFFLLGLIIGGEAFFRDYVMRGFIGYMVVEYLIIALGILNLSPILKNVKKIPRSIIPWFVFCLWAGVSLVYSEDILLGRWFFFIYLSGLFTVLLCTAFNYKDMKKYFISGVLAGACLAFGTAFYNQLINPISTMRFGHSFLSAVQVGIFLTVGIMMVLLLVILYNKKVLDYLIPLIALATGAALTFSRGPIFGLGIMLPFLLLNPKKKNLSGSKSRLIFFLILLIGSLYLFVSSNYAASFNERFVNIEIDVGRENAWDRSIELWQRRPLTGWGVGSWAIIYPRNYGTKISDAHSFFFQILVETGGIGILLTLMFLFSTGFFLLRKKRFADLGILAYIVSVGLVENWKIAIYFGLFALLFMTDESDQEIPFPKETNASARI